MCVWGGGERERTGLEHRPGEGGQPGMDISTSVGLGPITKYVRKNGRSMGQTKACKEFNLFRHTNERIPILRDVF